MLTNQLFDQHVKVSQTHARQSDLNRLLAAAVVSHKFCSLLLSDPAQAISKGYAGETFSLTQDEYEMVLSCRATTLPEFAQHISKRMPVSRPVMPAVASENYHIRI